jgi:hypothetical protein
VEWIRLAGNKVWWQVVMNILNTGFIHGGNFFTDYLLASQEGLSSMELGDCNCGCFLYTAFMHTYMCIFLSFHWDICRSLCLFPQYTCHFRHKLVC